MIIDAHGHTVAPPQVYEYQAKMIARRAPMKPPKLSKELISEYLDGHRRQLEEAGTDVQFISPRPYTMMHSLQSSRMVRRWITFVNDLIAEQCRLAPDTFRGVAGLPQFRDDDPAEVVDELERCIADLGFVGCLLNPDPLEGERPGPPGLGDQFWYPVYEKLCELDVPALIHSASCAAERESYSLHFINEESIAVMSLLESQVFEEFPDLKIVVGHGGGAIPYQIGRFRSSSVRQGNTPFEDRLKQLSFDTCVYSREGLELLFKVVGPENCLFGTERPGTGSPVDPDSGRSFDDLKPVIDGIEWLSDEDRHKIFEGNAKELYRLAF